MTLKRSLNLLGWFSIVLIEFIGIMLFTYHWSVVVGSEGIALPKYLGRADSFVYFNLIEKNFLYGTDLNHTGTQFVPMMTAVARFWGSTDILAMKSLNMVGAAGMLIGIIATIYSIRVGESNKDIISIKTLLRIAIFPSILMAVSLPFGRDVWIYMFFMSSVFCLVKLIDKQCILIWLPLLYISVTWLMKFRGYAGASVVAGILLYLVVKYISKNANKISMFLFCISAIGLFFLWFEFFRDWEVPVVNLSLSDALNYQSGYYRNNNGDIVGQKTGYSDFMGPFNTKNFVVFLVSIIQSYVGNLVGPFPWQLTNLQSIYVFLFESMPMMYLIYRLISKRRDFITFILSNNQILSLVCQSITWWTMLALSNKNVGTGMRLKVPLFIFIWIIYYFFLESQKKKDLRDNDEKNYNLRNI